MIIHRRHSLFLFMDGFPQQKVIPIKIVDCVFCGLSRLTGTLFLGTYTNSVDLCNVIFFSIMSTTGKLSIFYFPILFWYSGCKYFRSWHSKPGRIKPKLSDHGLVVTGGNVLFLWFFYGQFEISNLKMRLSLTKNQSTLQLSFFPLGVSAALDRKIGTCSITNTKKQETCLVLKSFKTTSKTAKSKLLSF